MASASYSFLDVAVLDGVRARFAAGDALAILSTDLEQVIWANGPGAALLGYDEIESILGAPARLGAAATRQISATSGFPSIGSDRPLLARLSVGMTSRAVALLASGIVLPDGERAVLLAAPADADVLNPEQVASRIIGGFGEAGHFVALVDGRGRVEAATPGFGALGISAENLTGLAAHAGGSRIVKRMIEGASGPLPAGLARLSDDPARHLLVVVDESRIGASASPAVPSIETEEAAQAPDTGKPALPPRVAEEVAATAPAMEHDQAGPAQNGHDIWYFSSGGTEEAGASEAGPQDSLAEPPTAGPEFPLAEPPQEAGSDAERAEAADTGPGKAAPEAAPENPPADLKASPAKAETVRLPVDRQSAPIRFVWRTDAQGKFSQISPEFVAAVSGDQAAIVGRRFEEVAASLGFDRKNEIAGLLDRRDTWSGRSVLWPAAGAGVRIPVDLAALPIYDRDRKFEGFRGFGVARIADAVADLEGVRPPPAPPTQDAPAEPDPRPQELEQADEPARPADPFRGETPALHIASAPDRRSTDKIIRLAEHRQPANDKGLSTGERIAFQQIAERLKRESAPPPPPAATESHDAPEPPVEPTGGPDQTGERATAVEETVATAEAAGADDPTVIQDALTGEARQDAAATEGEPVAEDQPGDGEPRKRTRPGMSLLDFAQWDRDSGTEESQVVTPPGEPVIAGETDPALAAPAETEEAGQEPDTGAAPVPSPPAQDDPAFEAALPAAGEGPDTAILAKLPVPVLVHSGDDLHYANDEFLALTGYDSVAQLAAAGGIGALFAETYGDEEQPERNEHQLRLITRGGEEFPVDAFLQSAPWNAGNALLLVLRRVEEGRLNASGQSPLIAELEARVAEMRTIIDTATDGVVLMTSDGTIRSISRPAEALFSFDSDEVAGKAFESLFAIESQRAARDYLNGLSDNGVASVLNDGREVIGRESRGRFIPLFMTIGKLPNGSGYCAVVRDITQWKRAEEELTQARAVAERSSSQKTDFLARVSHEIRTPLNAIIGFSELMVDERFGPVTNDRYRDYLRDINRSGNHVLDLVNDLLDISKIEAGQQEMDYEAVSLNDALAETVAMMQPQANRERVIIRSSFASKLPDVVADLRSVRQIALNLLSNAVRYTQAGGQVIVSTAYEPAGDIVMRVRDTGIGMTQAEIEQALKPFKQINSLKRARGDGTGLGLPLTKAMVEANRAQFAIHSTPGEGTLVEVSFPSTRVLAD